MMSQYLALSRSPYGCWVAAAIDDGDEFVASHTSGCKIIFGGSGLLGSRPEDDRTALAEELGFVEKEENDEKWKDKGQKLNKVQSRLMELELEVKEWIADRDRWFERYKEASADRDKALARVAELEAKLAERQDRDESVESQPKIEEPVVKWELHPEWLGKWVGGDCHAFPDGSWEIYLHSINVARGIELSLAAARAACEDWVRRYSPVIRDKAPRAATA